MENFDKERVGKCFEALKKKDDSCIFELHRLISPTIMHIALKYLQNVHDSEDLVQEFWKRLPRTVKECRNTDKAFFFICKTMNNMAINRCKQINNSKQVPVHFVEYSALNASNPERSIEDKECQLLVESAMKPLSEVQKIIIQATYFECLPIRKIAKSLRISKSQVCRLKLTAMEIMKQELEKDKKFS